LISIYQTIIGVAILATVLMQGKNELVEALGFKDGLALKEPRIASYKL
jgi:hypothetical protein